jgi:hypothetical protein
MNDPIISDHTLRPAPRYITAFSFQSTHQQPNSTSNREVHRITHSSTFQWCSDAEASSRSEAGRVARLWGHSRGSEATYSRIASVLGCRRSRASATARLPPPPLLPPAASAAATRPVSAHGGWAVGAWGGRTRAFRSVHQSQRLHRRLAVWVGVVH